MRDDLKNQLFSGILLKTKSEPFAHKFRKPRSPGDLLFAGIAIAAAAGVIMFLIAKMKPLL